MPPTPPTGTSTITIVENGDNGAASVRERCAGAAEKRKDVDTIDGPQSKSLKNDNKVVLQIPIGVELQISNTNGECGDNKYNLGDTSNESSELRVQILEQSVDNLAVLKLGDILDPHKAYIKIAKLFMLTMAQLLSIGRYAAGGGNPHERFLDAIYYVKSNKSIKLLEKCFITLKFSAASAILRKIINDHEAKNKVIKYIGDLTPYDFSLFNDEFMEDPNVKLKLNWKHVAEELGMEEYIEMIKTTIRQENAYSPTEKLMSILNSQGKTIGELLDKVEQIDLPMAVMEIERQIQKKIEREIDDRTEE